MSRGAKRLLLLGIIVIFALFISGLVMGAIGASFVRSEEDKATGETAEGIIPEPDIHLPAQPIFPSLNRQEYLDFLDAEHAEKEGGEAALHDQFGKRTGKSFEDLVADGPFGGAFKFVVTNTLLSAWIVSLLLVVIFFFGARKRSIVPGRLQNLCEITVEVLLNFVESVAGKERGRLIFPIIATIFLFVLFNAWIGLIPIYQSLGFKENGEISIHLLRPAGTDLNMPLALALISFVFVESLGLRMLGLSYLGKFVRVGSLKRGLAGLVRFSVPGCLPGSAGLCLYWTPRGLQRVRADNQLYLQAVRKHAGWGDIGADVRLPGFLRRCYCRLRTGASCRSGPSPHLCGSDPRVCNHGYHPS